jgi:hypothetical protein
LNFEFVAAFKLKDQQGRMGRRRQQQSPDPKPKKRNCQ